MSGYHTSIIVDDREYFFDSLGIMVAPPLWSHFAGRVKQPAELTTEVIPIGRTAISGMALVKALQRYFEKGSYDIFYKNCNTFSDAALYFLTKQRMSGRYNRIERLIIATNPVSTGLINRLFRAFLESNTGADCEEVDVYVTNPVSEGFSVDNVIASFEEETDSESDDDCTSSDSDNDAPLCSIRPTCFPRSSYSSQPVQQLDDRPW